MLDRAVIFRGGMALVSMAERMAPSGGAALGAGIVDNNQSFDNQSMHNQSIAGYQVAQQQLAGNFSAGSVIDDG